MGEGGIGGRWKPSSRYQLISSGSRCSVISDAQAHTRCLRQHVSVSFPDGRILFAKVRMARTSAKQVQRNLHDWPANPCGCPVVSLSNFEGRDVTNFVLELLIFHAKAPLRRDKD